MKKQFIQKILAKKLEQSARLQKNCEGSFIPMNLECEGQ
jgi:hypothetical protein